MRRVRPPVAVVGQRTATGKKKALSKGKIRIVGSGLELTVIGVTGDVVNTSLNETPVPAVYYASAQRLWPTMDVAVRTQGDPENAIEAARRVLRDLDPVMPMANVKTLSSNGSPRALAPRLDASLVALFAASALLIGAIGIYGVLSFSVSQRKREIGVRLALGAQRANVVKLIFGEGMAIAAVGIALGVGAAIGVGRVVSGLLFEVRAHDPDAFLIASLVLAAAAAVPDSADLLRNGYRMNDAKPARAPTSFVSALLVLPRIARTTRHLFQTRRLWPPGLAEVLVDLIAIAHLGTRIPDQLPAD